MRPLTFSKGEKPHETPKGRRGYYPSRRGKTGSWPIENMSPGKDLNRNKWSYSLWDNVLLEIDSFKIRIWISDKRHSMLTNGGVWSVCSQAKVKSLKINFLMTAGLIQSHLLYTTGLSHRQEAIKFHYQDQFYPILCLLWVQCRAGAIHWWIHRWPKYDNMHNVRRSVSRMAVPGGNKDSTGEQAAAKKPRRWSF